MRCFSAMILLTVLLALSAGPVPGQDALNITNIINTTNVTNLTNITNETVVVAAEPIANVTAPAVEAAEPLAAVAAAPAADEVSAVAEEIVAATEVAEVEEAAAVPESATAPDNSRFKQLSEYVPSGFTALGSAQSLTYTDVSQTVNRAATFTRDAGELSPAVKVAITRVGTGDDKFVEVTNKAVGEWDISDWALASAGNITFTFPSLTLEENAVVRVHEGEGIGSETDIYTNSSAPLWIDNLVSLQDAEGDIISTYDVSVTPAASAWVNPLANQIQY